jgi:hypothetical protein
MCALSNIVRNPLSLAGILAVAVVSWGRAATILAADLYGGIWCATVIILKQKSYWSPAHFVTRNRAGFTDAMGSGLQEWGCLKARAATRSLFCTTYHAETLVPSHCELTFLSQPYARNKALQFFYANGTRVYFTKRNSFINNRGVTRVP